MAAVAQNLQPGLVLSSSLSSAFDAPTGTTVITSAVLANPTGASVAISLQIKRASGTVITLVPSRTVLQNGTDLLSELTGRVLAAGDNVLASGNGLHLVLDGYALS